LKTAFLSPKTVSIHLGVSGNKETRNLTPKISTRWIEMTVSICIHATGWKETPHTYSPLHVALYTLTLFGYEAMCQGEWNIPFLFKATRHGK